MTSYMDYTSPSTQFTFDLNSIPPIFKKDNRNYINVLSTDQLNTLENTSLLDIYLSTGNFVEPHYHQNAAELVYCISGAAIVSILNPFTKELLHFPVQSGQVANVPQGWWHYEVASVDNTHLLAIFDAPIPEVIFGSDILRLTPSDVLAHNYCLNEAKVKDALSPITRTVAIGPPSDCSQTQPQPSPAMPHYNAYPHHVHPQPSVQTQEYGQYLPPYIQTYNLSRTHTIHTREYSPLCSRLSW